MQDIAVDSAAGDDGRPVVAVEAAMKKIAFEGDASLGTALDVCGTVIAVHEAIAEIGLENDDAGAQIEDRKSWSVDAVVQPVAEKFAVLFSPDNGNL